MPKMVVTLEMDYPEEMAIYRKDENASQSKKNVIIKDAVSQQVQIAMKRQGYPAKVVMVRKAQS